MKDEPGRYTYISPTKESRFQFSGQRDDEVDWRTLGFDAYLQKPVEIKQLDTTIRQLKLERRLES